MSAFAAPAWDVGASANNLCKKFNGNAKSFDKRNRKRQNNKGAHQGKKNKQNHLQESGAPQQSHPRSDSNGTKKRQENISSRVRFKTEKNNFKGKRKDKGKKKKNVNSDHSQKPGKMIQIQNGLHQTTNRNMHKKGLKFADSVNSHKNHSLNASFHHNSNNKKFKKSKKNSQFTKRGRDAFASARKEYDGRSGSENALQNGGTFQNMKANNSLDSNAKQGNKNRRNKKRNFSQSSETKKENNQMKKKRKLDNDMADQLVPKPFQKKTKVKKNFHDDEENSQFKTSINKKLDSSCSDNFKNHDHMKSNKVKKFKTHKNNDETSKTSESYAVMPEKRKNSDSLHKVLNSPFFPKKKSRGTLLSLRERMLLQLKSSRFRFINEQLYTSQTKDAEYMFKEDPNLFKVYHDGFRQQVEQWPVNPIEKIIKTIQRKPANLVVADFGCGDALLAKSVPNKVYSFDLVALSDDVTVCDMAHTPLENDSIDICVFCLSLMGTNLGGYVVEANRILKVGGALKIAEVASRFDSVDQFVKDMKKYGFNMKNKDLSHDLFYFINFIKDSNLKKLKGLPKLSLNPCLYKKR